MPVTGDTKTANPTKLQRKQRKAAEGKKAVSAASETVSHTERKTATLRAAIKAHKKSIKTGKTQLQSHRDDLEADKRALASTEKAR